MKTDMTREIEIRFVDFLYEKKYELAVMECALGARKKYGIVDVLSYHGKLVSHGRGKQRTREVTWRCYEVKTSKQDFFSPHKWTFIGDYNYFVVPEALYDVIKNDIPKGVGCYIYNGRVNGFKVAKKASKARVKQTETQMMHDYLVSNNRDARRWVKQKSLTRKKK